MTRSHLVRGALATAAVLLVGAAPATAAPDREHAFENVRETHEFQSTIGTGAALTAETYEAFPCDTPLQNCDDTLVSIPATGRIVMNTTPDQATLTDVDLHLYRSDETGAPLEELASVTNFTAEETLAVSNLPAGHYLLRANWSSGAGSFAGKVGFTPKPTTA